MQLDVYTMQVGCAENLVILASKFNKKKAGDTGHLFEAKKQKQSPSFSIAFLLQEKKNWFRWYLS